MTSAEAAPALAAQAPDPRRWRALGVIAIAQLMVVLDASIVNIAMPSMQQDLGISDADRQWIITAYTLAFGGLATSANMLYAARALQGVFGALLAPAALALITVTFVDSKERASRSKGRFNSIKENRKEKGVVEWLKYSRTKERRLKSCRR